MRRSCKLTSFECVHCHRVGRIFGRGLCRQCYGNIDIRHQYTSVRGWSLERSATKANPIPPEPTEFLSMTEEKMKVLEQRAAAGQQLFHPNDAVREL